MREVALKMGYASTRSALKAKEKSALLVKRESNEVESSDKENNFLDGLYQAVELMRCCRRFPVMSHEVFAEHLMTAFKKLCRQQAKTFVSLTILSILVHYGLYMNLPGILYPQLDITLYENSWVASLFSFGNLIGGFIMGPVSDKFGRKPTCIFASIVTAATWAVTFYLPENFDLRLLYVTRFIGGVANSLANAAFVYVSETTNRHWRPIFLNLMNIFKSIGIPISAVIGSIMPWRSYALFCLIMAVFHIFILFFVPESPHWLIRSDPERAEAILKKLNKNQKDFEEDWKVLEARKLAREDSTFKEARLFSREVRRPMLCLVFLFTIQQFGGVYVVGMYALQIFQAIIHPASTTLPPESTLNNATLTPTLITPNETFTTTLTRGNATSTSTLTAVNSPLNYTLTLVNETFTPKLSLDNGTYIRTLTAVTEPLNQTLIPVNGTLKTNLPEKHQPRLGDVDTLGFIAVGVIRVVMGVVTIFLTKYINNRAVLISSAFGGAVFAFAFAAVSLDLFGPPGTTPLLVFTLLFEIFLCYGVHGISLNLVVELTPLSYRAKGTGMIYSYANVLLFVTFTGFPYVLDWVGMPMVFVFFGIFSLLMCVYAYFFVPETRGKTFAEIEEFFM